MVAEVLLVVDVQPTFSPPDWLVSGLNDLAGTMPSVASVERHREDVTPRRGQRGWHPAEDNESLVRVDRVFIKHGFLPTSDLVEHLVGLAPNRVLVAGMQADTCVLAAGFALFDAGLYATLLAQFVVGSSVDRTGQLGTTLWRHHFGQVVEPA